MRIPVYLVLLFISTASFANGEADSSKTKLQAGATVSINSNGIASIPAFSLGKPAIISAITLVKNRFSYDPVLAYGLDMKPWFIDNWLHYKLVDRTGFELRAGMNFSVFSSEQISSDTLFLKGERYFAFAMAAIYKISPKSSLKIDYWNDRGQEDGTIKGHFLSLTGERSDIHIGKSLLLTANLMLFYINYDGNNDGLFASPTISSSLRDLPFSLYFQATQAFTSNIKPFPGFRWNIGISYDL